MDSLFSFLKVIVLCGAGLLALALVLLALPQSRLRSTVMEILGWTGGVASAALIVSPVDIIPDVIPVAGQVDDVAYLLCAVAAFWMAWKGRVQRLNELSARRGEPPHSRNF